MGFLFDAGAAIDIKPGDAVFLRFRASYDGHVMGESDDVEMTTRYFAYGFYAGFESSF
jgi:hypothetical protein